MRAEVFKSPQSSFKRSFCAAGFAAVVLSTTVAWAHHSFAMFDFSRTVTIKGSVREFQWANPHVILWVEPEPKDGAKPAPWFAELTSPGNLTRVGWDKRVFKGGDRVELIIHPLRDGKAGGAFKQVTLLDTGKVWTSDLRAQEKPGLK